MNTLDFGAVLGWLGGDFAVRLTQALAHFLWQGCVIGTAFAVVDRCLARSTANARYALGVATLVLMAACLPITFALVDSPPTAPVVALDRTLAPKVPAETRPLPLPEVQQVTGESRDLPVVIPEPVAVVDTSSPRTSTAAIAASTDSRLMAPLSRAAPFATACYLAGVLLMALRLAAGLHGGRALRLASTPLSDESILVLIQNQARRLGMHIAPAIACCPRVAAPVVVGLLRPTILLPMALATGLAPAQLESLLVHELAHVRRYDLVVNLLQRAIEALLFFHPAVWYVSRRVSAERENACDDLVVRSGWGRVEYADALVRMAEHCAAARGATVDTAALLAATGGNPSQLKRRVLRLLGIDAAPGLRLSHGGMIAFLLVVLSLAAAPLLVETWAQPHRTALDAAGDKSGGNPATAEEVAAEREAVIGLRKLGLSSFGDLSHPDGRTPVRDELWSVPAAAWDQIGRLISLEELTIVASDVRGEPIRQIGKLRNLRRLAIVTSKCTPLDLKPLATLTQLEHLDVTFTIFEENEAWAGEQLGELTPAERAQLDRLLAKREDKRSHQRYYETALLTDRSLIHLAGLKKLKSLKLINTSLTGRGLEHLRDLTQLEELDITGVDFSPDNVRLLHNMPALRKFRYIDVTDESLAEMSALANLEDLDVWSGSVTDVGARHVTQLTKLKKLGLRGSKLTNEGLRALAALQNLEMLDLTYASGFTPAGVADFRESHPGCNLKLDENGQAARARDDNRGAPQAGRGKISIEYNIRNAARETGIILQRIKSDAPEHATTERIRRAKVANGERIILDDLLPGTYQVARTKEINLVDFSRDLWLDLREIKVEAGQTTEVAFVRKGGRHVHGHVLGFEKVRKEAAARSPGTASGPGGTGNRAFVVVRPENTREAEPSAEWQLPLFDAALCEPDGRFGTDLLAPGTYRVFALAYRPMTTEERGQSGIIEPGWAGSAKFTVAQDVDAPDVQITLEPYRPGRVTRPDAPDGAGPNPKSKNPGMPDAPDQPNDNASNRAQPDDAGLVVRGNVVDAKSGEPVASFAVVPASSDRDNTPKHVTWQPQYRKEFRKGQYEWAMQRPWNNTFLRFDAPGYRPFVTKSLARGMVTLNVQLQPDAGIAGVVQTPDGKPAKGAQVAVCTWTNEVNVRGGKLQYGGHGNSFRQLAETAADGTFKIPSEVDEWVLVVAHDSGYAEATAKEFAASSTIVLKPWGRVEGRFAVGDKPIAGQEIDIGAGRGDVEVILHYSNPVATDADGRFIAERVPPAQQYVSPWFKLDGGGSTKLWWFSGNVQVEPGKTLHIDLPRVGQPVVGQIKIADGAPFKLADLEAEVSLSLRPPRIDFGRQGESPDAKAYREFMASDLGKSFRREGIAADAQGKFRVDDLPETEYIYAIRVYKKRSDPQAERGPALAAAGGRVTISPRDPAKPPVDLGEIVLSPKEPAPPAANDNRDSKKEQAGAAAPKAAPATGALRVDVRDPAGEPVDWAYVTLWREVDERSEKEDPQARDWTDGQRRRWRRAQSRAPFGPASLVARFDNLAPGTYRVTVATFEPLKFRQEDRPDPTPFGTSEPVKLAAGAEPVVVPVTLAGDTPLELSVSDKSTAKPIEGVALRLHGPDGEPIVHASGSDNFREHTGPDGKFLYGRLKPGRYQVEVLGKRATMHQEGVAEYAPLEKLIPVEVVSAKDNALTIELKAAQRRAEARPALASGALRVDVSNSDGKPASNVYVTLWRQVDERSEKEDQYARDWTDRDGKKWRRTRSWQPGSGGKLSDGFRELVPGVYRVTAATDDREGGRASGAPDPTPFGISDPMEVASEGEPPTAAVVLAGDTPLELTVVDKPTGRPIERAMLRLFGPDGAPIVHGWGSGNFFERTRPDGKVLYRRLRPGKYKAEILGKQEYWYNVGVAEYAALEQRVPIEVAAGKNNALTIALDAKPLTEKEIAERWPFEYFGRVTDENGKPASDVEIRVHAGIGTLMRAGIAKTDADGRYRVRFNWAGAAGDWVVAGIVHAQKTGWSEVNNGRQGDLRIARRRPAPKDEEEQSATTVYPNEPRQVDFVMRAAATISIRMLDADGKPLAGRSVILTGEALAPGSSIQGGGRTDEAGEVAFSDVPLKLAWHLELDRPIRTHPFALDRSGAWKLVARLRETELAADKQKAWVLGIESITDDAGAERRNEVLQDDPLAGPPLPEAEQARARQIMKKVLDANRYWLVAPPAEVRSYSYDFQLTGEAATAFQVADPKRSRPSVRQGITFQSVVHRIVVRPEAAVFRMIDEQPDTIRLAYSLPGGASMAVGNGIQGHWKGFSSRAVSEGILVLDAKSLTIREHITKKMVEKFSNYVAIRDGSYAPQAIEIQEGKGTKYAFDFRIHEPGLWLFAASRRSTDGKTFDIVAHTDKVKINGEPSK